LALVNGNNAMNKLTQNVSLSCWLKRPQN